MRIAIPCLSILVGAVLLTGCSAPARVAPPSVAASTPAASALHAKIERASVEERCDDLAAARFTALHDTDPVFVAPLFSDGAGGAVIVQQHVPFIDAHGRPRTAFLFCSGRLRDTDNTVTAKLIALATEKG